jgi:hypothetical protein
MFVGNNSDKKVPKDQVNPIKAIPIHKNKVTRTGLPEFKKKKRKTKKNDGRCGINKHFYARYDLQSAQKQE